MVILNDLKIAENGWLEASKLAKKLVKPNADLLEITEKIENKVRETCGCAFPLNISFNNQAAHFTPLSDTKQTISENDIIKIDIGTHSNGHIVDAAFTIDLSDKNKRLSDASKDAVNSAIDYICKNGKDTELGKLGEIIENKIKSFGFKPIYNLTGHSLDQHKIHAGESIFNYATNSKKKIGCGLFAIEPFATTGSGMIHNGNHCGIYFYNNKNTRNTVGRSLIDEVKNYYGLPFAERWIGKNIPLATKKLAINSLVKEGVFKSAPVLEDIKGSLVSQHEKTVYITEEKVHVFPNIDF